MAERRPLCRIAGVTRELPAGDTLPGSVPAGGAAGQVLTKTSASDYATAWADPTGGGGGVSIAQAKAISRRYALILG